MVGEWKTKIYSLNELGDISRGRSRHRPRDDESLYGGIYPFVQTGDVKNANLYLTDYSQTYSEKGLTQSKLWEAGTLCITIAANIAETAILGIDACFPDSIVGFIPYEGVADVRYVKYYFDIYKKQMQAMSLGATQDNFSVEKMLKVKFIFPDFPTQTRIAEILSAYDDAIENNNRRIALLEKAARELYREWFVRMRFPGYENAKFVNGLPEGWSRAKLKGNISYPTGKLDSNEMVADGKYSFYTCAKVVYKTDSYCYDGECVLLGGNNATGDFSLFYANEKLNAYQRTYIVTPMTPRLSCPYIFFMLEDYLQHFKVSSTGAATKFLTKGMLDNFHVILPSQEIADEYRRVAKTFFDEKINLQAQNQNLTRQRDLLLPRLMSGKLEV
jgi:type I restriction enzyme S subunit